MVEQDSDLNKLTPEQLEIEKLMEETPSNAPLGGGSEDLLGQVSTRPGFYKKDLKELHGDIGLRDVPDPNDPQAKHGPVRVRKIQ